MQVVDAETIHDIIQYTKVQMYRIFLLFDKP